VLLVILVAVEQAQKRNYEDGIINSNCNYCWPTVFCSFWRFGLIGPRTSTVDWILLEVIAFPKRSAAILCDVILLGDECATVSVLLLRSGKSRHGRVKHEKWKKDLCFPYS
jgi:hypothetical protein